jgi:flagellar basal-body rod protein FlgB
MPAMDFGSIPLFRAMAKRMSWLGEREKVLAQNVANADTPGYVPQDLKQQSFRDLLGGSVRPTLAATNAKHFTSSARAAGGFATAVDKGAETTPSGNRVSLEQEMMKVGETATQHHLVTSLYRRQLGMLRAALGRVTG